MLQAGAAALRFRAGLHARKPFVEGSDVLLHPALPDRRWILWDEWESFCCRAMRRGPAFCGLSAQVKMWRLWGQA